MPRLNPRVFFEKQALHSKVKSEIVTKYFTFWIDFMKKKDGSLNYLDLFSGRGYYDDGNKSTPLMILDEIDMRPEVYSRLSMSFYEKETELFNDLRENLMAHPGYHKLKHEPAINNISINNETVKSLPINDKTLTFIDPCGYSGLSEELLLNVIGNWGNDCIFYLSSAGIRRNINKECEREKLIRLFGEDEYLKLREELVKCKNFKEFDKKIIDSLNIALNKKKNVYSCGLRIDFTDKKLSNYYLMFISKHWLGFKIMKEIMTNYSLHDSDNVPEFVYNERLMGKAIQRPLIRTFTKMEAIKRLIIEKGFKNSLLVQDIYIELHNSKFAYNDSNIRDALIELEDEGKIIVDVPSKKRISNGRITLSPKRKVTFN